MVLHGGMTEDQMDHITHQKHSGDIKKEIQREKAEVAELVKEEFEQPWDPNDAVQREMHMHSGSVDQVIYGGAHSSEPEELQLVRAWRLSHSGEWTMGTGVIHRVHQEDRTVTVQFLPDQHRCRLPFMSVKPVHNITPTYPVVRLGPGERLPSRAELLAREKEAHARRQALQISPHAPLPGAEDPNSLRAGEILNEHGVPTMRENRWGIPGPTLDALRNRSIPALQVTGPYGPHFYTKLYSNNFYPQEGQMVSSSGHVGLKERHPNDEPHIISHRYIPLDGPELDQDLRTGAWQLARGQQNAPPEPKGWLAYFLE